MASALAGDRSNLEKRFREWLARCHAQLDKRIRFCALADPDAQARAGSCSDTDMLAPQLAWHSHLNVIVPVPHRRMQGQQAWHVIEV